MSKFGSWIFATATVLLASSPAFASSSYDQVFASPATIKCTSDVSCSILDHIRVQALTYVGNAGSGFYTWTATCASAPDAVFYIRPTGATLGCFQMDGFSASAVPLTNALTSAHILVGNASNVATSVAMSGTVAISNTGVTTVPLTSAHILVGNSSNIATSVAVSGTVNIDNTGATSIPLTSANVLVGNGSNKASGVGISGDAALSNAGALTVNSTNGKSITATVSSIANLQAIGTLSGAPITAATVTGTQGDGSTFLWVGGSLPCNSVSGGGDGGTTFCASNGAGGYRTDGYWQRQGATAFVKDVWFGIVRDGSTDNTSVFPKWLASCQGKIMLDTSGTAIYSTVGATIYTPPENCTWQTVPGSNDNFTVNTSSQVLINNTHPNFAVIGTGTVTLNVPSSGFSNFIYPSANNLLLKDFTFDGGMADNGTSVTTGSSRLLYIVSNADATGITLQNIKVKNVQSVYTKYGFGTSGGTCDTSAQTNILVDGLIATNVYAFGLNFNSPCGSQTNIKVTHSSITSAAQTPLLSVSSAPIGIGFASGKDIIVDGNTVTGAFLDALHLEQDVQNVKIINNHVEIPSGVTGNVNRGLDIIPADVQTSSVFKHPVHGVVANNTFNLTGSTTGATAMGLGVWRSSDAPPDAFAEDFDIHNNIVTGAWPTGLYDEASNLSNTVSWHDNISDGATTGMFVYRGGSSVYNNTSKNCTTGLLYTVATIQSHNFNGCTQTLAGAASTSVLWIGTLRWDFAPVSLAAAASQTYELLDLDGTNTRLTGLPSVSTNSTDGTARVFNYVGGTNNSLWDGTTYANAGTLNTLTALAVGGSGAASSFARGTSGCAWGNATSCWNFSLTNSAGTTQSISATVAVSGGAYIRKGQ